MLTKICTKCLQPKPITRFALRKVGMPERRAQCTDCKSAYMAAYKRGARFKTDDMPEQAAPEAAQAAEAPSASKRPSRLQKVAEQAPAAAEQTHWHDSKADGDGVIDMETSSPQSADPADGQPAEEHDSPI